MGYGNKKSERNFREEKNSMIEIIGEPKEATPEEIKEFENKEKEMNFDWREALLRTFLANH